MIEKPFVSGKSRDREKLKNRLAKIGFATYGAFRASPGWLRTVRKYKAAGLAKRCAGCGYHRFEPRHTDYLSLGTEDLASLVPLCSRCYRWVEEYLSKAGLGVEDTGAAVRWLFDNSPPKLARKRHGGLERPVVAECVKCLRQHLTKKRKRVKCPTCGGDCSLLTKRGC